METNERRPTAALINREWYESAAGILGSPELGALCRCAVEYVLYGREIADKDSRVGLVFAMVRPALDSDITRYNDRCARNAANAQRKRLGASGCDSVRVGASGEQLQPQPQQQLQLQPQSISQAEIEKEDIDRFVIYGYFWSIGSKAIKEECTAFWAYYEALGWKNNKGAAIVNRLAAARMWRRQFETGEPVAYAAEWFKAFSSAEPRKVEVFNAFRGARLEGSEWVISLRCSDDFAATFMEVYKRNLTLLQRYLGGQPLAFDRVR